MDHQVFENIDDVNTVELTDSYKGTHWLQTPDGTKFISSFLESRGGAWDETVFFGLQYYLMKYLGGPVVTLENMDEAADDFELHFGTPDNYNRAGWRRIVEVHGGRLPVEICAVPEGMVIPTRNVLMTGVNTDPELPWVTNYLETLLSKVWYPITVATQSREMKKMIKRCLEETGTPEGLAGIDFKLHDFGDRGSTSVESAGIGGMAHLVNFKGTDTLQAIRFARKYYGERMAGYSIPAAEHSTMTSWGGPDHEVEAFANMLTKFPTGTVAVVSDSYDIFRACSTLWGKDLKARVMARDGVLVVRPDSGYPPEIVVTVLNLLGEAFGYVVNGKGYKVLNPKVRVIQGDGIDIVMLGTILEAVRQAGWSAENLAFGSGGGLLQKVNRDTCKFAFKCSAIYRNGAWHDVMKDPVTDPGKKSKAGRLALVQIDGEYRTVRLEEAERLGLPNLLVPVFRNGEILVRHRFEDVRLRAAV